MQGVVSDNRELKYGGHCQQPFSGNRFQVPVSDTCCESLPIPYPGPRSGVCLGSPRDLISRTSQHPIRAALGQVHSDTGSSRAANAFVFMANQYLVCDYTRLP